jgi:hypothetical protein
MDINAIFRLLLLLIMSLSFSAVLQGCGTTAGIPRVQSGNSITLAWQEPYTNNDGSELVDLAGFKIYYVSNRRSSRCNDFIPGGDCL